MSISLNALRSKIHHDGKFLAPNETKGECLEKYFDIRPIQVNK
jgi:hypothetical protein